jgi:hypothetical protein
MNILKSENQYLKKYIQSQKCQSFSLNKDDQLIEGMSNNAEEFDNFDGTTDGSSQIVNQINNNFNNYFYSYSNLICFF